MKVLIANRGEIALRIIKTCQKHGFPTVAIYTEADALSLHVRAADETIKLPDGPLSNNYLNIKFIVSRALEFKVKAIHPGYGFLSECCDFARAIEDAGMIWVGPTSKNIEDFASKHVAKRLAISLEVPTLPSSPLLADIEDAKVQALILGYPIMIKSSDAGGGIGMFKCNDEEEILVNYPIALQKSKEIFKSEKIFLEKFLGSAHHIEIQVVGDGKGGAWAIGERECSAQRRNQKVIEESPSPFIHQKTREEMKTSAVCLAKAVNYKSLGTVEFIVDQTTQKFYFLEVNNRLQVEHPVTELTFGIDLVKLMLDIAFENPIDWEIIANLKQSGHSIEARVYAENPYKNFQPSTGRLSYVSFPLDSDVRIDTWVESDIVVSPNYDPLLAKIIVKGDTREEARKSLFTTWIILSSKGWRII
jgi:urea carboxylase